MSTALGPFEQRDCHVRLPRFLDYRNVGDLFRVCEEVNKTTARTVVFDGQDVEFVDPLGIAVLGALLEPRAGRSEFRLEWLRADIGSYLARMNVVERCQLQGVEVRPYTAADRRLSLVELTRLSLDEEVDGAAERLSTAIVGSLVEQPGDTHRYAYPLQYSLRELMLNGLTHAKRHGSGNASVWVAAQHYPKDGVVRVAVVDNGCGALKTLENSPKLQVRTHAGAIMAALEPFVTCNPDIPGPWGGETSNRGIGLTTTRRIAAAANGRLVITSGNASVSAADRHVRQTVLPQGSAWDGVAILMTCQRSRLPSVNVPSLFPQVATMAIQPRFVD